MELKYSLTELKAMAERDPRSPAVQMLARGRIEGDDVYLDEIIQREIRRQLRPRRLWVYTITHLQLTTPMHPDGYVAFILARGKIENGTVILSEAAHKELQEKFLFPGAHRSLSANRASAAHRPLAMPRPPVPTLAALATNFTQAMAGWAGAGFKVVERKEYERRHAVCLACEYWEPDARLGLGKCKRCLCSKFKLWLVTSKCPDKPPRW